jgi:hypothetical protein
LDTFSSGEILNPRLGKYQTAFGDIFIDFGFFGGCLELFFVGFVFSVCYVRRLRGSVVCAFLDPLFRSFFVLGIIVNPLSGGLVYFLVGMIFCGIFVSVYCNARHVQALRQRV